MLCRYGFTVQPRLKFVMLPSLLGVVGDVVVNGLARGVLLRIRADG
jgi:hypothetical protein